MLTVNQRLTAVLISVGGLLLIPLIAMQFTPEVNWTFIDFVVAGVLLLCTGLVLEFILRKTIPLRQKVIYCTFVLLILFLIWAELAVGIFGTPFAGS